uniref:Homeobox domain-containing protein n=1 Tax=Plectus sambesii TaxID=2011161 RepID=A0A914VRG9_9BILA
VWFQNRRAKFRRQEKLENSVLADLPCMTRPMTTPSMLSFQSWPWMATSMASSFQGSDQTMMDSGAGNGGGSALLSSLLAL